MKDAKFVRNGKAIISFANGGSAQHFESITKAKAESRAIQMREDGALGRGSLKVEK